MCGIAGILHFNHQPVDHNVLRRMADTIAHRGPDGQGFYIDKGVGLAHRRLAIIDLSPDANQPMQDISGNYIITFNGEIYNYKTLRNTLANEGHKFNSQSDTEVILEAYKKWGPACVRQLEGIFAFAIWDSRKSILFIARDHLGVKPFFYLHDASMFIFGSEIKAVIANPSVDRTIDQNALNHFFSFNYTPAPLTGIKNVCQLPPGNVATVDIAGNFSQEIYWDIELNTQERDSLSEKETLDRFTHLFTSAVKAQTVSDVPIAAFLSGGVDSSAIAWALSSSKISNVKFFNMGFKDKKYDESALAAKIAKELGEELICIAEETSPVENIIQISKHFEEPTADASALPFFSLSKAVSKQVKVALSGDGADEILAGYKTYSMTLLSNKYRGVSGTAFASLARFIDDQIPALNGRYSLSIVLSRIGKYFNEPFPRNHCSWRNIFSQDLKERLFSENFFKNAILMADPVETYASSLGVKNAEGSALAQMLYLDTKFYLPNDMLLKADRMSMAHGLEVRVPFLDRALVEFCFSLSNRYKIRNGTRKYILRRLMSDQLGKGCISNAKRGFNAPIEYYFRNEWKDFFPDVIHSVRDEVGEFLNIAPVMKMFDEHIKYKRDYRYELFSVLMFGLWIKNLKNEWK